MNLHSFRCLEYSTILDLLAELAASPLGREECLNTLPATDQEAVRLYHMQVKEIGELESSEGPLPLFDIFDIRPQLKLVQARGSVLDTNELLEIKKTLGAMQRLRSWRDRCDQFYPNVRDIFSEIIPLDDLFASLDNSISEWGTVKDSASARLRDIREKLNALRERINSSFDSLFTKKGIGHIFQDRVISVRNNRFVVAVRSDSKGMIKGIIHDVSQSKATVYLEPLELVSLNNEWNELHQAEKAEERKILARLSAMVRENSRSINRNLEVLGKLDALRAKARFGKITRGRTPEISENEMRFRNAYHPLLLLQYLARSNSDKLPESLKNELGSSPIPSVPVPEPVPISLTLTPQCRAIIISGPNAGGKTVTLKTVGLLSLMNQSGIPVPVGEGSRFKIFEGIYVDIGDEQDIQTHLSTFSARVENLKDILQSVSGDCLVLLDELGTGTDPSEGAALALAIIEHLCEKRAWFLVTTHFHTLKAYGAVTDGIENASVSFDENTGKPTFQLKFGLSGTSNAFEIARHYGFPATVLERARVFLDQDDRGRNQVLSRLEEVQRRSQEVRDELEKEREYIRALKAEIESERRKIEDRKNEILKDAAKNARKIIDNAESEFRRLLSEFRKEGLREAPRIKHQIAVIKKSATKKLRPQKSLSRNEANLRGKVAEGELVKILSCDKVGRLVRLLPGRNLAEVQVGNIQVQVPPAELLPYSAKGTSEKRGDKKRVALRFPLPKQVPEEVNLVGKTVEEAIEELDKIIDSAILAGVEKITIIHGHGTGRLRAGIHSYLDSNPQVSNFYFPELRMGGRGVTVVELKG